MLNYGSSSSSSLGTSSSYPRSCSHVEERKITAFVGDVGSSTTTSIEVGESLDWISDLCTLGSLCLPANDGMWVWLDCVALRGLSGVSSDIGIELLPLFTNLPLESLSLCINIFYHFSILSN